MKKILLLVSLFVAVAGLTAHAQQTLVEYDIRSINGFTASQLPPSTIADDVSASGITYAANLEPDDGFWENLSEGLFLVKWDDGAFNVNNNYLEFTVSATGDKKLALDNLTLGVGRESTSNISGPMVFRVYSSLDGYGSILGQVMLPPISGSADVEQATLNVTLDQSFDNIESVTFRIHGHNDVQNDNFLAGGGLANFSSASIEVGGLPFSVGSTGSNVVLTGSVFDPDELTLTNAGVSNLGETSATFGASIPSDGGLTIVSRGFVYSRTSENSDPVIGGTGVSQVTSGSGDGAFSETVTGFDEITQYTLRAYVSTEEEGTEYSDPVTFATLAPELARFDIESINGFSLPFLPPASVHPNLVVSNISYAGNLSIDTDFWENAQSAIMLVGWEENFNTNESYFEFTVEPEVNHRMTLNNITIGLGRESSEFGGTGPEV
ncbi:hypothetical protein QLX67_07195, partial [Balneolaceae bacterium ANBcel3]|nr:hypothetical protein [Balneolaceae bacterium ANBcel3]